MKRLSLLFLMLFGTVCSSAVACDTDLVREYTPIADRMNKGMLYVVDNCKQPASYVFGSVHLDDKAIVDAAKPAFTVLKKSKRALFEMNNDKASQQQVIASMVLPPDDPRKLSEIIGSTLFSKLSRQVKVVQPGFPDAMLNRYSPWAASVLVQLPPATTDGIMLDDRLQMLAVQQTIETIGLESPDEQMQSFTMLSEKEQILLLSDTLAHIGKIRSTNEKLKKLYLAGDLAGIARMGETAFSEISNTKLRRHMRHFLISKRNKDMVKSMLPHLHTGKAFVAVGALHLPGEEGILNQLEKKGYFLWPLHEIQQAKK